MSRTLLLFLSCILFTLNAQCQEISPALPKPPAEQKLVVDEENVTFSKVETEAEFPGGISAWTKYLQKHLKANTPIKNKAPNGTWQVIVRFIVAKDGTISNVVAETRHGYGMEEEVIRVITKGPKWTPAQQNGKMVNAYRRQPITFVVQGK